MSGRVVETVFVFDRHAATDLSVVYAILVPQRRARIGAGQKGRPTDDQRGDLCPGVLGPAKERRDDRGAYRVFRLPPGEYLVVALQGHGSAAGTTAPPPLAPVSVTTFYPSAVDVASALPVAVKGGDDLAGLDIQVRSELTHSVSGRVTSMLPRGSEVGAINGAVRHPIAVVALLPVRTL